MREGEGGDLQRRPLKSRQSGWAKALAGALARRRVRPNAISLFSVVFAAIAGGALWAVPLASRGWATALPLIAAAGIQLRLLCNLLDGMVAIEGGMRSKTGEIWNDLPDRIADALILLGAGYGLRGAVDNFGYAWGPLLGWLAATFALLTAYVRVLGGAAGASQPFGGPMAKPHRMATLTVACLLAAGERWLGWPARVLPLALALIVVGSALTAIRRTRQIARELQAR